MKVLELINIRLHDSKDGPLLETTVAGIREAPAHGSKRPVQFELFQNAAVPNDWLIQIQRPAGRAIADKSLLAASLVESFRPLGRIHHVVWAPAATTSSTQME